MQLKLCFDNSYKCMYSGDETFNDRLNVPFTMRNKFGLKVVLTKLMQNEMIG